LKTSPKHVFLLSAMWLNPAPERPSSGRNQERLIWHE
jgi:hypothetical protein